MVLSYACMDIISVSIIHGLVCVSSRKGHMERKLMLFGGEGSAELVESTSVTLGGYIGEAWPFGRKLPSISIPVDES